MIGAVNDVGLCAVCVFESKHTPGERVRLMAEGLGPVIEMPGRSRRKRRVRLAVGQDFADPRRAVAVLP